MSRDPKYDPVNNPKGGEDPEGDKLEQDRFGPFDNKKAVGQVTIRTPVKKDILVILALLYGFLPWLIPIGLGVYFFVTWHFIYIYGVLISLVLALINEVILKKIFNQPRPPQSANKKEDGTMKPGMPSGHVLNSTTIMVWSLMEVGLAGPGLEGPDEQLTMMWLAIIFLLMFPVPWARWYNLDHTLNQCIVSIIIGTIVGVSGFYIRVHYFSGAWKPWFDAMGKEVEAHTPIVSAWIPPWISWAKTAAPKAAAKAAKAAKEAKDTKLLLL